MCAHILNKGFSRHAGGELEGVRERTHKLVGVWWNSHEHWFHPISEFDPIRGGSMTEGLKSWALRPGWPSCGWLFFYRLRTDFLEHDTNVCVTHFTKQYKLVYDGVWLVGGRGDTETAWYWNIEYNFESYYSTVAKYLLKTKDPEQNTVTVHCLAVFIVQRGDMQPDHFVYQQKLISLCFESNKHQYMHCTILLILRIIKQ